MVLAGFLSLVEKSSCTICSRLNLSPFANGGTFVRQALRSGAFHPRLIFRRSEGMIH